MLNFELLKRFNHKNNRTILENGKPWARFILLSKDDPLREIIKQDLLFHPEIKKVIERMYDPDLGINSCTKLPADYRIYGSFYWGLRFLADIGLTGKEWLMEPLIKKLQLQQFEHGQFLIRYHRKRQQTISLVCITAHLTYCLIRLGYAESPTVKTALDFVLSTQRRDGGWHCDLLKQVGERDESAPSCLAANIHVIRVLGQYGNKYKSVAKPAIKQCLKFFEVPIIQICIYNTEQNFNLNKLRYPPHYTGLDILNVVHSLSYFADLLSNSHYDVMINSILNNWDGESWLRSGKRIPNWSGFDFCKKSGYSEWITSLFLQSIDRVYFMKQEEKK